MKSYSHKITSWQFIALGYLAVILLGCLLLSLPVSSKSGEWTPFINSLFTSVSATCVTGLVVYDTFTHWSLFGQLIILFLIQIGGIGFMTIVTLFAMLIKKHIGLYERKVLAKSAGALKISGIIKLIKRILLGTVIFEGLGIILLSIRFCPQMGMAKGIYYAVFHSISAFCNAGFDIMGFMGEFSSFTNYSSDVLVNLTLMALIFLGGIGFLVWSDILDCKLRYKKFNLYTKSVLITSAILIVLSTVLFMVFERNNLLNNLSFGKSLLASLFHSVTPRTAGFNTLDISAMTDSSILYTIILMVIGGSSGSTAGGIKITTFVVLMFGTISYVRNHKELYIGKKRLDPAIMHQALALFSSYVITIMAASLAISAIETTSLKSILFEVVSALGTVGLSTGITGSLSIASKAVIMLLMFIGRVGIITLAFAFVEKKDNPPIKQPLDKMLIG